MGVNDFAKKGMATPHDVVIAGELAKVLTGGEKDVLDEVSEQEILKLEREAIVTLCKTKGTRDRILHMLKKGKPLRN
jgi:3-hydroxyacyl-CoA dehydrogenase